MPLLLLLLLFTLPAVGADGLESRTLDHAGVARHYLLARPGEHFAGKRPLVIVLHGGGGSGENAAQMTGFTRIGQREGVFVAYPDGMGRFAEHLLTWNAGHCCGYAMREGSDDVGFIAALIDTLVAEGRVDPQRVYVTGLSNGGMLTHRLGRELAPRLAAIAPVIATLFGDEPAPVAPLPVLTINGAEDERVRPQGGVAEGRFARAWDGTPYAPLRAQGDYWAKANGCQGEPQALREGKEQVWRYHCPEGRAVEQWLVAENGHAWPGGEPGRRRADMPSERFDASERIWAFFARFSRP